MVISRAVERFPKSIFDTMVLSMSQRHWYTQKAPKIIEVMIFTGSRVVIRGGYVSIYIYIYIHIYTYMRIYTVVMN